MEIPDAEAAVDREGEKLENLPAWQMTKVNRKKEVTQKAQDGGTVHFGTLMDICQNAELEQKFRTFEGRVVLRGDVVRTT